MDIIENTDIIEKIKEISDFYTDNWKEPGGIDFLIKKFNETDGICIAKEGDIIYIKANEEPRIDSNLLEEARNKQYTIINVAGICTTCSMYLSPYRPHDKPSEDSYICIHCHSWCRIK